MYSTVACLLVISVQVGHQSHWEQLLLDTSENKCKNLLKYPNYREELVVGNVWREYYSWNIFSSSCQTTEFLVATRQIINRFKLNVNDSMKDQPEWEKATMLVKNGKYEMLMFRDVGPPGRYKAVPNFVTHGNIMYTLDKLRLPITFLRFAFKLVRGFKFLMMMDCRTGLAYLLGKVNDTVDDDEVLSIPDELEIGNGYLGCWYFIKSRINTYV